MYTVELIVVNLVFTYHCGNINIYNKNECNSVSNMFNWVVFIFLNYCYWRNERMDETEIYNLYIVTAAKSSVNKEE